MIVLLNPAMPPSCPTAPIAAAVGTCETLRSPRPYVKPFPGSTRISAICARDSALTTDSSQNSACTHLQTAEYHVAPSKIYILIWKWTHADMAPAVETMFPAVHAAPSEYSSHMSGRSCSTQGLFRFV